MSLIRISRQYSPVDHQKFHANRPKSRDFDELSIRWRKLGDTGVTLVDRGEFQRMIGKSAGKLATANVNVLAQELKQGILAEGSFRERIQCELKDVDFFGEGSIRSIAYVLDAPKLEEEHAAITRNLDERNGVNSGWREFEPHVSVASIPAANMDDAILDTFWNFAPETMTLFPARAQVL